MRFGVYDVETTGLLKASTAPLSAQPQIIEFGLMIVENGTPVQEYNQLIDPGVPLPAEIVKITGIHDADLRGQPKFADVAEDIFGMLRSLDGIIAHNMPFDSGMLNNECARLGRVAHWPARVVCSVEEFKHMFGRRMRLIELYQTILGKELAQTHRAIEDCRALHELLAHAKWYDTLESFDAAPAQS